MRHVRGVAVGLACYFLILELACRLGVYVEHTRYSTAKGLVHTTFGWHKDGLDHETLSRLATAAHHAGRVNIVSPAAANELARKFDDENNGFLNTYNQVPRAVTQTDLARLLAVYFEGGLYIDVDVVVRGSVIAAANGTWFVEKIVSVNKLSEREALVPRRIANYAFAAPARCPLLRLMLEEAMRRCKQLEGKRWTDADVTWVGPDVVTTIVTMYPEGTQVLSKIASTATIMHLGKGVWKSQAEIKNGHIWVGALASFLGVVAAYLMIK